MNRQRARLPWRLARPVYGTPDVLPGSVVAVGSLLTGYVPIAGTWSYADAWYSDRQSPFAKFLYGERFEPIRDEAGLPFRWSTDLDGVQVWARHSQWQAGADALRYFLHGVPYEQRNVISHSHGGQVALIAAAAGCRLRSLTTVGTPVRADVPALEASKRIGLWQHIHDETFDLMGSLGAWFDRHVSTDRFFDVPGVVNISVKDISHSKVLRDPAYVAYWEMKGWLDRIRSFDQVKAS